MNCSVCGSGPLGPKAQQKGLCKSCSIKKTLRENADAIKEKKKATCLAKYGVEHYMQSPVVKQKVAETTLKNYGGIGFASKQLQEKVAATCEEKYQNSKFKNRTKQLQTKQELYGDPNYSNREQAVKTCLEIYGTANPMQNKEVQQKAKNTCKELYGAENPYQSEVIKTKIKKIKIERYGTANNFSELQKSVQEKYGVENIAQIPEVREKLSAAASANSAKRVKTLKEKCLARYGVDHPSKRPEVIQKMSETALNRTPEEWQEIASKRSFKQRTTINGIRAESSWEEAFIKTHPGCKRGPVIPYLVDGVTHHWDIDFEWNGRLYEIKNPWMLDKRNIWPGNSTTKFLCSREKGVSWYLWKPGEWRWPTLDPIEEFRATKCHVGTRKNPWEAFNDPKLKFQAEENLARYITWPGMLTTFFNNGVDKMLYQRFTIAKIAPKVTVGSVHEAAKSIQEAIAKWGPLNGIFNPCAGFGGWAQAAVKLNLPYTGRDINPFLIKQFGWEECDLLSCDPITTDYTVWTSPPVFEKETWGQEIKSMDTQDWYDLVQQKVKAPHYIFVNGSDDKAGGLFGNKHRKVVYI